MPSVGRQRRRPSRQPWTSNPSFLSSSAGGSQVLSVRGDARVGEYLPLVCFVQNTEFKQNGCGSRLIKLYRFSETMRVRKRAA